MLLVRFARTGGLAMLRMMGGSPGAGAPGPVTRTTAWIPAACPARVAAAAARVTRMRDTRAMRTDVYHAGVR